MHPRLPAVLGLLFAASLATACSDSTAPMQSAANQPAFASGSGGGGTGGGGTGGGGGGTGGGGGGGGTSFGRITAVSAAASCDAGTSIGISLDKGFNNRVNVTMGWVANPVPVGPAIPPSTFPQTSLGGWWDVSLKDAATGATVMGFGTGVGATVPSMQITSLGGGVSVGVHTLTFRATNTPLDPTTGLPIAGAGVRETCTATLTVVAR